LDIINIIFQNRVCSFERLIDFGFRKKGDTYFYKTVLSSSGFEMNVSVTEQGSVSAMVWDTDLNEPYTLHLVSRAVGEFVGKIKSEYEEVLNNITIASKETVLKDLKSTQTAKGYYSYRDSQIGKYRINGKEQLVYLSPREIVSSSGTYNNKTYEYTHGYGAIITSATATKENGTLNHIQKGFETFINPADRREVYHYYGKTIHYLRMKQENPETLQNALDTIARDKSKKAIWMGLYEIKDFPPAYTNTFYFFDCNFEKCVSKKVEEYVCFSKTVAYDTANRMIYAGADKKRMKVYDVEDDFDLIFEDLKTVSTDNIYIITGMKPYKKIKAFFEKEDTNEK